MKDLNDIQSYVFVCIISADNDEFGLTEDQKQEILHREKESDDWSYILECMKPEYKNMLVKFFNGVEPRYENDAPLGQGPDGSLVYMDDIAADEHETLNNEEPIQDKTLESSEESPKVC